MLRLMYPTIYFSCTQRMKFWEVTSTNKLWHPFFRHSHILSLVLELRPFLLTSTCYSEELVLRQSNKRLPSSSFISACSRQRCESLLLPMALAKHSHTLLPGSLFPDRFSTLRDLLASSPQMICRQLFLERLHSRAQSFLRLRVFSRNDCSHRHSPLRLTLLMMRHSRAGQLLVVRNYSNKWEGMGLPVRSSLTRELQLHLSSYGFLMEFQLRFNEVKLRAMPQTAVFLDRSTLVRDLDFLIELKMLLSGLS